MKKHQRISILLTCLLLALPLQTAVTEPLQINAAEALPAGGITTTVSDSRFIDAGWMNQNIILTLDGQVWAMGINMMKDYPVFLSNDLGVPQCILGDTAVIDVFLNAINEQLKAQVFQSDSPVFDTGTGSYIYNSGQTYYQLNANVKNWLITTLQQQFIAGTPQPITLELTSGYLTSIVNEGVLTYSPDFVLAGSCTTSFSTSSSNRINNIKVAAGHLNNMIIMPGQEVSVSTAILPRTSANGYREAGAYLNGETVMEAASARYPPPSTMQLRMQALSCWNAILTACLCTIFLSGWMRRFLPVPRIFVSAITTPLPLSSRHIRKGRS